MKSINTLPLKLFTLCFACCLAWSLYAGTDAAEESSENWPTIKANLFAGDRVIHSDDIISLTTPTRAEDAAIVPVSVTANREQSNDVYIRKIYLVVDNNPSPVVGVFTLSRQTGLASIATRIRVNAYSDVRAIAETSDGQLHMAKNFVKASGGCSAPAGTNDEEAEKRRGKMKLRQQKQGDLMQLQLLISHPNHSGLQLDQISRLWIPADYVNDVRIFFNSDEIISFSGGISMSENPSIRFYFKPDKKGTLLAEVKDSKGREYRDSWPLANP